MKIFFRFVCGVLIMTSYSFAQSQTAEYHSAAELKERLAKLADEARMKNTGSTGADIGAYGTHALKLSYRRESGQAEVHAHFADFFVVQSGSATLITGGSVVEPKTEGEGEVRGKQIDGGARQVLSAGDIVVVPAKTPHQLILDQGKDFKAFVMKIPD